MGYLSSKEMDKQLHTIDLSATQSQCKNVVAGSTVSTGGGNSIIGDKPHLRNNSHGRHLPRLPFTMLSSAHCHD